MTAQLPKLDMTLVQTSPAAGTAVGIGSTVTYRLTIDADAAATAGSVSNALSVDLGNDLTLVAGSISVTDPSNIGHDAPVVAADSGSFTLGIPNTIPVSAQPISITFQATVANTATNGEVLNPTADITYQNASPDELIYATANNLAGSNSGAPFFYQYDYTTNTLSQFGTPSQPQDSLAFVGDGNVVASYKAYNGAPTSIALYNPTTGANTILVNDVQNGGFDLCVSNDGKKIYFTDQDSSNHPNIRMYDLTTHTGKTIWQSSDFNGYTGITFTPDGKMYGCYGSDANSNATSGQSYVVEISPTDGHIIRQAATANGSNLDALRYDPFTGDLFVGNHGTSQVYQVDTTTLTTVHTFSTAGTVDGITPTGAIDGLSADGLGRIFVTNVNNSISVIDVNPASATYGKVLHNVLTPAVDDTVPVTAHDNFNTSASTTTTVQAVGSLSGHVFLDRDADGVQESGETALSGVSVQLLNGSGAAIPGKTTTTDASGNYSFTGLAAGNYAVKVTAPSGDSFSPVGHDANPALDSIVNGSGQTSPVTVTVNHDTPNQNAGVWAPGAISGHAFFDNDGNGVQDSGDANQPNVTVQLLDANGNPTGATATTNSSGAYTFSGLAPGSYGVKFTPPAGDGFSPVGSNPNPALDSFVDKSGEIDSISVTSGTTTPNENAGLVTAKALLPKLDVGIAHDAANNCDGGPGTVNDFHITVQPNAAATDGASQVHLVLTLPADLPLNHGSVVVTDPNGGNWTVTETATGFTADLAGTYDLGDQPVTIAFKATVGAGATANEALVPTVNVLYQGATTDEIVYATDNVNSDFYQYDITTNTITTFGHPTGHMDSLVFAPDGDLIYTQQNGASGLTKYNLNTGVSTTLVPGQGTGDLVLSPDGTKVYFTGFSGGKDQLWVYDITHDTAAAIHTYNSGEYVSGLAFDNTTGKLYAAYAPSGGSYYSQPNGYLAQLDPTNGNVLAKSAALGEVDGAAWDPYTGHLFVTGNGNPNLTELNTSLQVVHTWHLNSPNGLDGISADGQGNLFIANYHSSITKVDLTKVVAGTVAQSNAMVTDLASAPNIDDTVPQLYTPTFNSTASVNTVVCAGSLSGHVWLDQNGDGVQQAGDTNLSGITVQLLDGSGNPTGVTATTNASGAYSFANLNPGQSYAVKVLAPSGDVFTPVGHNANATIDSIVNASGQTAPVTIVSEQDTPNQNAGLYVPVSLSGHVFLDKGADGVQQAGDTNIPGVSVQLLDGSGNAIPGKTATTDGSGAFSFTGLAPGSYAVKVVAPAADPNFSPVGTNSNAAVDSIVNAGGVAPTVTLTSGQSAANQNAGVWAPGSLSGHAFLDQNGDGVQQAGDSNIPGLTVQLLNAAGSPIAGATATTDGSGAYSFGSLTPGQYQVKFSNPAGDVVSPVGTNANAALDSIANAGGTTPLASVVSGSNTPNQNEGLYVPVSYSGHVFKDVNADGVQQAGDTNLSGVTVQLLDGSGNPIAGKTTTTDGSGAYSFTNLAPGSYEAKVVPPAATPNVSPIGTNADPAVDSVANPVTAITPLATLTSGQAATNENAGLYAKGSLSGHVFLDQNGDGVQQGGDGNLAGLTVQLLDSAGNPIAGRTATTDGSGAYSFGNLTPGQYQVKFTNPAGDVVSPAGTNANPALDSIANAGGVTPLATVASGTDTPNQNEGLYAPVTVSGHVFLDRNADGVQQAPDTNLGGVTVQLLDGGGTPIAGKTTTTAPDGSYSFTGLPPGSYEVKVTAPAADPIFSPVGNNPNPAVDSIVNGSGLTAPVTLTSGQSATNQNAGVYAPGSLSGHVWLDQNGDGVQQAGDANQAGISVQLLDAGGTPIAGKVTTTAADGSYSFGNLTPGNYEVKVTAPAGDAFSKPGTDANPALDSLVNASGVTPAAAVTSGTETPNQNGAFYVPVSYSGHVFLDRNADGVQESGDTNLAGITVQLLDGSGNPIPGKVTTTDSNGAYSFTGLPPGSYEAKVVPLAADPFISPVGHNANPAIDSVANPTTGITPLATLTSGQSAINENAGVFANGSLSGKVFLDSNADGVEQGADMPLGNITVQLLDGAGIPTGATTTTAPDGSYSFAGLHPGAYSVHIVAPGGDLYSPTGTDPDPTIDSIVDALGNTHPVAVLSGQDTPNQNGGVYSPGSIRGHVFLDANANGVQGSGDQNLGGITVNLLDGFGFPALDAHGNPITATTDVHGAYQFTSLPPGNYQVQVVPPGGDSFSPVGHDPNPALDSIVDGHGLTAIIPLAAGQNVGNQNAGVWAPGGVSGHVWLDQNGDGVQQPGDTNQQGVQVQLLDGSVNPIAGKVTTTAADGSYSFSGLMPGQYAVKVVAPSGDVFTPPGTDANPALDSVVDGSGKSPSVQVLSGAVTPNLNAGDYAPVTVSGHVFIDGNDDGVQNGADANQPGVTVQLLDGSGNPIAGKTAVTDGSGAYSFGGLPPGQYAVHIVTPAGDIVSPVGHDANPALNSIDNAAGVTPTTPFLTSGQAAANQNGGLSGPGTLSGHVFLDTNGDGVQEGGETNLAGLTVQLLDASGNPIAGKTATTDAAGHYQFTGLLPAKYEVKITPPSGDVFSPVGHDANPALDSIVNALGITPAAQVLAFQDTPNQNAGVFAPGHIKGTAFEAVPPALCADKLPGAVFAGITVKLLDASNAVVATTTTGADGTYQIDGVSPGSYKVQFVSPSGLALIPQHSGWLDDGSDADPATGTTGSFVVLSGQTVGGEDAGFAHLTGTVADSAAQLLPGGSYTFSTAVHVEFQGSANVNLNAPGSYIQGGNGSLTANANAGGSILIGGTGYSSLNGGPNGGAVLMGGQGGANIEGTSGNDIIIGGCGPISAQGLGSNSAQGLGASAGFLANLGGDLMLGGKGGDTLEFNNSTGTVSGGAGDDYIHAAANGVTLAGGTNNGTISYSGGQLGNLQVGDVVNGTGANETFIYQAGDGVQKIENFNAAAGDTIQVWGFAGPTAVGQVNGMGVLYFGPNQAIVLNGWNPGNGPLTGVVYHAESSVAPGAIDHISPLVPVVLGATVTTFYGAQGDDIVVGSDSATTFRGMGGNDYMVGGAAGDVFYANDGTGNSMFGNGGDDSFYGATGSDSIDGGAGTDKVIYGFGHGQATLTQLANGSWEVIKPVGVDILANVEKVQFADGVLTLASNSFVPSLANDPDFNGDGRGDLLFHNDNGMLYQWQMNGAAVAAQGSSGWASTDWHITGTADFNGDAKADILWQNTSGAYYLWTMDGTTHVGGGDIANPGGTWQVNAIADFNGDHKADILWRNADGALYSWEMNGTQLLAGHDFGTIGMDWQVRTTGDFNGDGKSDLLWQNATTGDVYVWQMNGGAILAQGSVGNASADWQIVGTGDFNGDGRADILWQNGNTGELYEWQMNGFGITAQGSLGSPGKAWHVSEIEDLSGDHKADLVLTDSAGDVWAEMIDGLKVASSASLGNAGSGWHLV